VAKESGQDADTIVANNIINMWSRMYAPCRRNAVWLINQDIEPQLFKMSFNILNASGAIVGGVPVYLPANGLSGSPYATLMGRPVIPTQACETVGDKGDIILVDLTQYMTLYKAGGIKTDVSMHLWFDYDVAAFRFIFRVTGQPWWAAAISPRDGSNSLSWAVTLDERA
jgi:HK97 family phage major capsid protein